MPITSTPNAYNVHPNASTPVRAREARRGRSGAAQAVLTLRRVWGWGGVYSQGRPLDRRHVQGPLPLGGPDGSPGEEAGELRPDGAGAARGVQGGGQRIQDPAGCKPRTSDTHVSQCQRPTPTLPETAKGA
eukprot:1190937-Prorocentrum_minimum.AAC.5